MKKSEIDNIRTVLQRYRFSSANPKGYRVSSNETELCQLAFKYGSDKCQKIKHPFTSFYYDLLNPLRQSTHKVLEIGVGLLKRSGKYEDAKGAASLYMWRDFFPNAQIYGADNDPRTMFRDGHIKTILCNQTSKENLENLIAQTGNDIDIVIDDGSHVPGDQIFTCLTLMPLLKKDILYIIEDVADLAIENQLKAFNTDVIYLWRSDRKRYHDDNLIVVRNKTRTHMLYDRSI